MEAGNVARLPPEEVEDMLKMERTVLEKNFKSEKEKPSAMETHEAAKRKAVHMAKVRRALGVRAAPGEVFSQVASSVHIALRSHTGSARRRRRNVARTSPITRTRPRSSKWLSRLSAEQIVV